MLLLAFFSTGFTASNENDEGINDEVWEDVKSLLDDYFTIENAEFHEGSFPESTDGSEFGTVTLNSQALSGGMNFITIRTERNYKTFYIGIEGINGYLAYTPSEPTWDGQNYVYTYLIPVYFSIKFNRDIIICICGETEDGEISKTHKGNVTYVESQSGDLNINLTFTTLKDVDLHLLLPDGTRIYYGNRGGTNEDGESYGLDHDSNAACHIDGLNNENIFIPASLVTDGTYRVFVDLYSNCDPSEGPTNWSVAARYKGEFVANELNEGRNPVNGFYTADAHNGDMTEVIRFTLTSVNNSRSFASYADFKIWEPIPLSDIDQMKLEEASWKE